jgi:DUF971 family protein
MSRRNVALSFLRRCDGLPLSPASALSLPTAAEAAMCTTTRPFTSFIHKMGDSLTAKVSQLTENVWLAEEKLVTEPRRKIEPQRTSTQSLAERLTKQRCMRQRLVPTNVKVDKSRQYVEFTWPAAAAEIMQRVVLEEQQQQQQQQQQGEQLPEAATPVGEPALSSTPPPRAEKTSGTMPLRTRALAEYLRAYTPSTDGALGSKDIVIYGRRGITIGQIVPIGNYALRFVFSDDHAGGIYSYEYLFYLTGPATKYGLMRAYIRDLRLRRKSRDPPKRAPSKRYANELPAAEKNSSKP